MNRQEEDYKASARLEEWLPSAYGKIPGEGQSDSVNQGLACPDAAAKPSPALRLKVYLSRLDH